MRDRRLVVGFQPMQWDRKPPPFKRYPGHQVLELPDGIDAAAGGLHLRGISRLLFLCAGVVRTMPIPGGPLWFRSAGSAGNLAPVEVYLVTGDLDGLDAGLYHYAPLEHGLVKLRDVPSATPPALVLTGSPWRTAWKYRERGFRHLFWDAGTLVAQALAVADKDGLDARVELGFVDHEVAALVGAEPPFELPLAVLALDGQSALPGAEPVAVGHLADDPQEFPLITSTWKATVLASEGEVADWRAGAVDAAAPQARHRASPLPLAVADVIRRRGSTRHFDRSQPVAAGTFVDALDWSTRPVPIDAVGPERTWLQHPVIVHGVDDVAPGAYRWQYGGLVPLVAGDLRAAARRLCLDQSLGGDSAFTVFHCADLAAVTAALGGRGYRVAQLEAGVVEGRLHLAAHARGLGATGLTFFDDEVSRFFGTDAAPMLVTAVGVPAYRSRPGGRPRQPVVMRPR